MPTYRTTLVGAVTDRWTKRGNEEEMALLTGNLNRAANPGERLHSLQPIPVFGGISNKQTGVVLLAVFERED